MLVSHRKKFIYMKTIKTAGTSVESYFEKYCMPENIWEFSHERDEYINKTGIIGYRGSKHNRAKKKYYNHMPANSLKNSIGHDVWDSYFKFCVIRNPYDKLISAYFFQNQTSDKSVEDFRSWLIDGAHVNDRQTYMIENKVCIDFFIRFEQLNNDVMKVCEKLNIPFIKSNLPKLKTKFRNRQIPLKEFYNDQTIRIVKKNYEFELDYFEYEAP